MNLALQLKKRVPLYDKIASREIKESNFIPYSCHYDPQTILTKPGDLLQVLKIEGLPFETADPQWLSFQKDLRNILFRSVGKSQYALYVHTIRRKQNLYPKGEFPHGFAYNLNEAWRNKQEGLELYVNDLYLTIVQKPKLEGMAGIKGWIEALSRKRNQSQRETALRLAHKDLMSITNRFLTNLKDYGIRLLGITEKKNILYSEPAQFFYYLINLEERPVLFPAMDLSHYLPCKRLFFGKDAIEIRGIRESKLAAILSVKEYSDETHAGILDSFRP